MKSLFTTIATCACATALLAAAPGTSFAGGGHGYKHHYGKKHHYGHRWRHGHGYRHHGYRRHGYRRHGFGHSHGHGLFFSYSSYGYRPYHGYRHGYPSYDHYPRQVYVQPPIQFIEPSPQYVSPPAVQRQPSPLPVQLPGDCRMIREYQTQIIVGGRPVDAYGDACLKADGSWERGPPKAVPQ